MSLMQYKPTSRLNRLHDDINQFFKFNDWAPNLLDEESSIATSQWLPSVDIKEKEKEFTVIADLPGVDPKDIDVDMDNGVLSIKGERKTEKKDEEHGYRRIERSYGRFHRRFSLPDTANSDKVTAKSKDGVLEIKVAKHKNSKARKIKVDA